MCCTCKIANYTAKHPNVQTFLFLVLQGRDGGKTKSDSRPFDAEPQCPGGPVQCDAQDRAVLQRCQLKATVKTRQKIRRVYFVSIKWNCARYKYELKKSKYRKIARFRLYLDMYISY